MRSQADRNTIINNLRDPCVLENILSQDEVAELIELFNSKNNKIHKNTGPVTSDITEDFQTVPVLKNLFSRIKEHIGECRIYTSFFFKVEIPHIIHNDDDKLGPLVYKAITVPLEIEYENKNTGYPYLCMFDQYYLEGPSKFFGGSTRRDIPAYYNAHIYEYSQVQNLSTVDFPQDIYLKYLTHLQPFWLKGLSFHSAHEWKPGNGILFDCVRLHCASDFKVRKIKSKLGLSIFTALNEDAVNEPTP